MKKITFLILFCIIIFTVIYPSENIFYDPTNNFNLQMFMMKNLPGIYFPNFFMENISFDTVLTIEENNGFSMFDNPGVYFEGNSILNFNHEYNGFRVNSAIDNGKSAVIVPFSSISTYSLKGDSPDNRRNGLNIKTNREEGINIFISNVFGNMGSYTPLGTVLIQPEHPTLRDDMLYYTRRKIKNSYIADFSLTKKSGKNIYSFAASHIFMKRQFNDFTTNNSFFFENQKGLFISSGFNHEIKNGFFEIFTVLNKRERSNLFAEYGRLFNETYMIDNMSGFIGIRYYKPKFLFQISFLTERDNIDPNEINPVKDIIDNDGDGILPIEKFGEFNSRVVSAFIKKKLIFNQHLNLELVSDLRYSELKGNEDYYQNFPLTINGTPYRIIIGEKGEKYTNYNTSLRSGLIFKVINKDDFRFHAKLLLDYSGINFGDHSNSFSRISPLVDLGLSFKTKKSLFSFSAGRYPVESKEVINFFLEKNRPSGIIYEWDDINSDHIYNPGEEKKISGYIGGKNHYLDENLKQPFYNRALILFSTRISNSLFFNIKGLYKKFFNPLTIGFQDEYGHFETENNIDFFYFDKPFKKFFLKNADYDKNPFYGEFLFNFSGVVSKRWFFSFSFMAHIGMGYTSFGNGPRANDIGILNENMADPNARINGYGRVDGDRGFVSKLFFGFHISNNLFFATSIKYRDGNPFAFLNINKKYGQSIIYYSTIQAEDSHGKKGGPREDYIADLSIKLSYRFKILNKLSELSFSFFNVIDLGGELSEYVFSGGKRFAMEMQIPKSLRVNLKINL